MSESRVRKSLSKLSLKFSGLSPFIDGLEVEAVTHLAVAGTNGSKLFFNMEWVRLLSDEQLDSLVMHEVIHVIDMHVERIDNRRLDLWNSACDIRANYVLRQINMDAPEGTTDNPAYDGMQAEPIYDDLENQYSKMKRAMLAHGIKL